MACRSLQPASCLGRRCCGPGLTPREPAAPITRPSRTLNPSPSPRAAPPPPSRTPAAGPCSAGAAPPSPHGDERCRLDRPQDRAQALAQPAPAQPVWLASRGAAGPQLTPGSEKWVTLQGHLSCDEGPGLRLPARGRAAARWPFPAEATPAELGGEVPAAGVRPSLQSPLPAPHPALRTPCPSTSLPAGPPRCQHLGPADSSVHPGPAPRAGSSVRAPGGVPDGPPHTHHPAGPRVSHPLWATPSLLLAPHLFASRELAPGAPSSATCSAHRLTLPAFRPRQPCRACPLALPRLLTADP